jgi:OOP family OmpA-OmpF porin
MQKKLLVAAILASVTLPVMASDFYVLADFGQAKYKAGLFDESDTSFSIGGGYKFNETFAAEFTYRDLGEIKTRDYQDLGGGDYFDGNYTDAITAIQASIVASFPVGQSASIYGRLGYADIDVENSFREVEVEDGDTFTSTGSYTLSENKVVYGVGFNYAMSEALALRAEYNLYNDFLSLDISTMSLGLTYQF